MKDPNPWEDMCRSATYWGCIILGMIVIGSLVILAVAKFTNYP